MSCCFIADLHLSGSNAVMNNSFIGWLEGLDPEVDRVYILGDFFDAWSNLEIEKAWCQTIIAALRAASSRVAIYFMLGNHDFLLDQSFAKQANVTLLEADDVLVDVGDKKIIILHGDTLVADDLWYQIFRQIIRSKLVRLVYSLIPVSWKQGLIKKIRFKSSQVNEKKGFATLDLNVVKQLAAKYPEASMLVCGHFHQAKTLRLTVEQGELKVEVLAAWDDSFSVQSRVLFQ
jgi:UDP-2,3-diacylglucosamine hydrolase